MSSGSAPSESELPWIEEWTEGKPEASLFPRLVRSVKQVKSGKGFLLETDVFIAFCFKKHPRALFIAEYLYQFETEDEAPSLKILPSQADPKLWAVGIDDDLAVRLQSENGRTTECVPLLVPSPSGKSVTRAYTHPDSQCNLTFQADREQQPSAPTKRARKPSKNEPQGT